MNKEKIVNFFFEIASMRRLTRSHRQVIGAVSDNIGDHSFRAAVIGMILAKMEKVDDNQVLKMCLFHDLAEARTGDANYVNQQYSELKEDEALKDQMDSLPIAEDVLAAIHEYEKQESGEAIIAKDADILDQIILQHEYFYNDQENKKIWHSHHLKRLKSESAKNLAAKLIEANPIDWVYCMTKEKNGFDPKAL